MNKLHIFCALALGFSFAACDEVEESNAVPQTYPQESPFHADKISVAPAASLIDLASLNAAAEAAQVATVSVADAPEGYTVELAMQIDKTADFAAPVDVASTPGEAGAVLVAADVLQKAYYDNFTHDPREAVVNARFAAYAVKGSTRVRMGGADYYYGPYTLNVKPFPATKVIEDSYTLELAIGGDFTAAKAYPFSHSDASPYDDPTFSVTADFSADDFAAGLNWRIVSASGVVFGPAGAADPAGDLLEGVPAGIVSTASPLLMTIDMLTDVYDYKQAYEYIYTPGTSNGWSGPASQRLTTTDYENYTGLVVVINGDGFKFNPDDDWKGHDVGVAADPVMETLDDGTIVFTGTANGSSNIKTTIDGLYYVEFNYSTKAFKLTYISTLGIIGDFNGWGESVALTPSADYLTWTSPATDFPAGCGWKFRANNGWGLNWGGSVDALVFNAGDNIVTTDAGKYVVTLDISAVPYTATLAAQ